MFDKKVIEFGTLKVGDVKVATYIAKNFGLFSKRVMVLLGVNTDRVIL